MWTEVTNRSNLESQIKDINQGTSQRALYMKSTSMDKESLALVAQNSHSLVSFALEGGMSEDVFTVLKTCPLTLNEETLKLPSLRFQTLRLRLKVPQGTDLCSTLTGALLFNIL